jgi:hypothetical protein
LASYSLVNALNELDLTYWETPSRLQITRSDALAKPAKNGEADDMAKGDPLCFMDRRHLA